MKNSNIFNNLNNDIRTEIEVFLRKFKKQYGGSFPSKYYKIHNVKYKNHLFKIEFELDYDETRTYVKILEDNGVCGVIIFDDDSTQCILQSFSPKTTCAESKLDISGYLKTL